MHKVQIPWISYPDVGKTYLRTHIMDVRRQLRGPLVGGLDHMNGCQSLWKKALGCEIMRACVHVGITARPPRN